MSSASSWASLRTQPRWHSTPRPTRWTTSTLRWTHAAGEDYLGVELDKDEQTSDFGREELTEAQVRYSLQDAEILVPLKEAMIRRVRDLGIERVTELEARFLPALAYCEN